jgi:threonine efflux protein
MNYAIVLSSIFAVHVLALVSPGPNNLIVMQAAMSRDRRAAVATALGIATCSIIWSSTALIGLNVVFAHFAWIYGGLKLLGGAYLLYLGIKMWRTADHPMTPYLAQNTNIQTHWQAYRLGTLTTLTNPKAAIFFGSVFTALLPPASPLWVKLAVIGIICFDSTVWHISLACFFSTQAVQQVNRRITERCINNLSFQMPNPAPAKNAWIRCGLFRKRMVASQSSVRR